VGGIDPDADRYTIWGFRIRSKGGPIGDIIMPRQQTLLTYLMQR